MTHSISRSDILSVMNMLSRSIPYASGESSRVLLSFKCPVCGEIINLTVEEQKVKNDPSGVYTISLLHSPPSCSPHLIVISIDPHGFVRSAYLYKQFIVVGGTEEEEATRLEKRIEEAKIDAYGLIISGGYDVLKETHRIIQAFRIKYREDIFLEILGNALIHYTIKSGKLNIRVPSTATISDIVKRYILNALRTFKIDAELYYGLEDTIIIKQSSYPIEFVRGIINGLLVKIGDQIGLNLILITESLNPILFRIELHRP